MARINANVDEFDLPAYGAQDDFDAITAAMGILSAKMEAISMDTVDEEFEVSLHSIATKDNA